ncbi:hypothetical protein lerEdw1_001323 [Lerista edwardsae]|nr:hypothetical protein lerEdw1_001323 [Lerista edwardsae]
MCELPLAFCSGIPGTLHSGMTFTPSFLGLMVVDCKIGLKDQGEASSSKLYSNKQKLFRMYTSRKHRYPASCLFT